MLMWRLLLVVVVPLGPARALAPAPRTRLAAAALAAVDGPPTVIEDLSWSPRGVELGGEVVSARARFDFDGEDIEYSYIAVGRGRPVLLIHGFGASGFHWRSNVATLAQTHRVYAIDLVGFGASDKPLVDYDGGLVWVKQCEAFLEDQLVEGDRAVLAGNSIGGYVALALAAARPDLVRGLASLNGAGQFAEATAPVVETKELASATEPAVENMEQGSVLPTPVVVVVKQDDLVSVLKGRVEALIQRFVIGAAFVATKQPARIEQVLRQVYPVAQSRVDASLVASIEYPARAATAAEVFYRIVSRNNKKSQDPATAIDALLKRVECPLLLCWGEKDPWIRPKTADRIQALCLDLGLDCSRVSIDAGHCPHDESPAAVNAALLDFLETLPPK